LRMYQIAFVCATVPEADHRPTRDMGILIMLKNLLYLSYNHMREKRDEFPFGANEKPDSQFGLDFNQLISGDSIEGNAPENPSGEGGSIPTSPLQKIVRAVNACDHEHNQLRVPTHLYSRLCSCDKCKETRDSIPALQFGEPEEISYGTYTARQLRFDRITEAEARNFIVPRNYLRRWFVGATLCFGAFSPEQYLVAASVLSAPAAHSKRFTAGNSKEVRRFVMLDCCGRNSESRFISWILREAKRLCPHLRFIFTFGNPKYDKETPYRAAGFRFDGVAKVGSAKNWLSHKAHRAREANEDKHRYVYTFR